MSADITGVSGTISDSEAVTISGTGFGLNALNHEWTGDNIENGTEGNQFSKTGWAVSAFPEVPRYDDTRAYSGSQSIVFDSTTESDGRFKLAYDWGSSPNFFYVSWMANA